MNLDLARWQFAAEGVAVRWPGAAGPAVSRHPPTGADPGAGAGPVGGRTTPVG